MKCKTARELMCGLGLNLSSNCEKDVCKFNSILEDHYMMLVNTESTKAAVWFTWQWIQQVTSLNGEDIYRVHSIAVTPCDKCCPPSCMHKLDSCDDCCNHWYWLEIHNAYFELDKWGFVVNNNKIDFNVGEGIVKWHVIYSRWPKEITSLDDQICVDPKEMRLLKASISKNWAEMAWDFEAANYFEGRQFKAMQQIEQIEDRTPYRISLGDK